MRLTAEEQVERILNLNRRIDMELAEAVRELAHDLKEYKDAFYTERALADQLAAAILAYRTELDYGSHPAGSAYEPCMAALYVYDKARKDTE